MRRLMILVLALALGAAACGDDDAGGEKDAAIASLRAKITTSQAEAETIQFGDQETLCMAEGIVEQFGVTRIIEAEDQEFEDFMSAATAEERRAIVDLTFDCADVASLFTSELVAQGLSQDSADCIGEGILENDAFRNVMADSLATGSFEPTGDAEVAIMEAIFPLILQCVPAEELAQLGAG